MGQKREIVRVRGCHLEVSSAQTWLWETFDPVQIARVRLSVHEKRKRQTLGILCLDLW
jgi:hypothetical protein